MLKKILKYTFRTLLVILLVLMLVPALLYIPAVQDFVRGKAVGYASPTGTFMSCPSCCGRGTAWC